MEYTKLNGMNLSQIVLGTEGYGERIEKNTAFEIMDFYIENGGNVIDTARVYNEGNCEYVIGEYIKGKRESLYISTKCAHPPWSDLSHTRLDEKNITSDVDTSLKALGIDYIDILWLHRDDETKAVEPIIDTLNRLLKCGKIKNFGASNWRYDRIIEANEYAKASGQVGFCASQALYNLATRMSVWDPKLAYIEDDIEKYQKGLLPVFAYSSQAKGFFEKYAAGTLSGKAKERYLNEDSIATFNAIKERAEKENATISYMALKMLREKSKFDLFEIVGPSRCSQLKETLNIK